MRTVGSFCPNEASKEAHISQVGSEVYMSPYDATGILEQPRYLLLILEPSNDILVNSLNKSCQKISGLQVDRHSDLCHATLICKNYQMACGVMPLYGVLRASSGLSLSLSLSLSPSGHPRERGGE